MHRCMRHNCSNSVPRFPGNRTKSTPMISKILLCLITVLAIFEIVKTEKSYQDLKLIDSHIPIFFKHHKDEAKLCLVADGCPYKAFINVTEGNCWGFEEDCNLKLSYSKEGPRDCASEDFKKDFWKRADFGYVSNILSEVKQLCTPSHPQDSSLVCSKLLRYCMAKNLYVDLRKHKPDKDRFKEDMFEEEMVGGHCVFNQKQLKAEGQHPYPLQSWYSELQNYTSLKFRPLQDRSHCDVVVDKPTIFMKLDSGVNLYHHFCDFFNLYLSQIVNNTWFGMDNQIVMWDTSRLGYFDIFEQAWSAFSDHPIIKLENWKGKRVCLREAMFSLLPRMRHGLYYNSYIPPGCVGSSLFRAFSEHFLHRMGVTQNQPTFDPINKSPKIRLTLLERGQPEDENIFRKIKNQDELLEILKEFPDFEVKVVQYKWKEMTLKEQLQITHNSDIFIGMHGAGLLHFLFLPDWAVAFELYNCGDIRCYHDIARLRGLDYITWEKTEPEPYDQGKHQRYGENPKFWNWSFEPKEFRKLVRKARTLLLKNRKFIKSHSVYRNNIEFKHSREEL